MHLLVDLNRSTVHLIILGIADVPPIGFETDFMIKKAKYSYRMRTISMTQPELLAARGKSS